ncbi:MAG: IS21 family transposase [Chloroflexi bacterium]|nr:MAG: IS21 family transposase [Chloroflexota bacterium]
MSNRRFEMYEYRQVIHRMRMGESDRTIARTKLAGRIKCGQIRATAGQQGWLDKGLPLPDDEVLAAAFEKKQSQDNPTHQSLSRSHEEQIRRWAEGNVQMTTIHQALVDQFGFKGSYSSVRRLVQGLKLHQPEATCVLDFAPGEAAQVDFGKGPEITDAFTGKTFKTWIFVMTLCFSRHLYAEIVTDQKISTWLSCHRRAFEFFNGVPAKMIIDNPKCAITKACFRDPEVQRSYGEQAEGYGFLISPCPPRDPQKKGRVESGVKYVKNRFVPLRQFRSLADANGQLRQWVMETAGNRIHGTTRQKPLTLFAEAEKHLLKPLPDVPVELAVWCQVKLHGNCHVQFELAYYSAPFPLIHQEMWLKATDNTVKIYHDLKMVAVHSRLKRPGARSTVDEHMPPEAIAYKLQDPQWCLRQAEAIGSGCHQLIKTLFSDRVLDNLRAAQGIVGLGKKYGSLRLENACTRALHFDNPRYKTVKIILAKGLDQTPFQADQPVGIPLSSVYTVDGRFLRPAGEMQLH